MEKLKVTYDVFNAIITRTSLPVYWISKGAGYFLTAASDAYSFYCNIVDPSDVSDFEANLKEASNEATNEGDAFALASININLDMPIPKTSDGKTIILPNLFPGNVFLYITGSGDSPTVRGAGTDFTHSSGTLGDYDIEWNFIDWVYIAGGSIRYAGAQLGDSISLSIYAPATPVTVNNTNTGNCNCVGPGGVLIVPAAGNGAYDVDLSTAVPVPSDSNDEDDTGTGYYNWTKPDTGTGTISAGVPGKCEYNLYTIPLTLVKSVNNVKMLGTSTIDLTLPAIKPKKIFPQWKFKVTVHNSGHAGLEAIWFIHTARIKTY